MRLFSCKNMLNDVFAFLKFCNGFPIKKSVACRTYVTWTFSHLYLKYVLQEFKSLCIIAFNYRALLLSVLFLASIFCASHFLVSLSSFAQQIIFCRCRYGFIFFCTTTENVLLFIVTIVMQCIQTRVFFFTGSNSA